MQTPSTSSTASHLSLGALAATASATLAKGAIVTNASLGLTGFTVGPTGMFGWDIDNNGGSEIVVFGTFSGGPQRMIMGYADNGFNVVTATVSSGRFLFNLPAGDNVAGQYFAGGGVWLFNNGDFDRVDGFTSGSPGYIGFKFNPSGSLVVYGWAEVVLTPSANTVQVLQWAYDDSGADIQVGDVGVIPEPANAATGLGLLALGAAGLSRWRRSRD